jgi:hypothetical protein
VRPPHKFVHLFDTPTDLEDWIADFCARKIAQPRIGPPFPALGAGETPVDWFIVQFDRLGAEAGKRDQLRTVIVRLIATYGGRDQPRQERNQIVGTLLNVARELKFTELAPHLRDWIRKPWFREEHLYKLGGAHLPLRRTVWELLLAWGSAEGVVQNLTRVLTELALSGETGMAQIAFVALGERDIDAALLLLPDLAKVWPIPYWVSAVSQFFRSADVKTMLSRDHYESWAECAGRCLYDSELDPYVRDARPFAEADAHRPNHFYEPIENAGMKLDDRENGYVVISGGGVSLKLNVSKYYFSMAEVAMIPERPTSAASTRLQLQ